MIANEQEKEAPVKRAYSNLDPKVRQWYREWRERLHQLEWANEEIKK